MFKFMYQVPNEDLRTSLDGIMKGCVLSGVLDLRVDISSDAQKKDDPLYVLIENS